MTDSLEGVPLYVMLAASALVHLVAVVMATREWRTGRVAQRIGQPPTAIEKIDMTQY